MKTKYIVFGFLSLLLVTCLVDYKFVENRKKEREEDRLVKIEKRNTTLRSIYFQHKDSFDYIQKILFSLTISDTENISISLEKQNVSIELFKENNVSKELRDKLLEDEKFKSCALEILEAGIKAINFSYSSYFGSKLMPYLNFEIYDDDVFIRIEYSNGKESHNREILDKN